VCNFSLVEANRAAHENNDYMTGRQTDGRATRAKPLCPKYLDPEPGVDHIDDLTRGKTTLGTDRFPTGGLTVKRDLSGIIIYRMDTKVWIIQ
jgi:hypothetical protein